MERILPTTCWLLNSIPCRTAAHKSVRLFLDESRESSAKVFSYLWIRSQIYVWDTASLIRLRCRLWQLIIYPNVLLHSSVCMSFFSDLKPLLFNPSTASLILLCWNSMLQFAWRKQQFFCFSHCSFPHKYINGFATKELNANAIYILCKSILTCFFMQSSMVLIS